MLIEWEGSSVTTSLGVALGLDSPMQRERLYHGTLKALVAGHVLGQGRHGVVVALSTDEQDKWFKLAVKVIHKVFTPSKGREPSFHRSVSHSLHLQNEVSAMAKLSNHPSFTIPLYTAFQDDQYVFLVMERACCSLKQLIQHSDPEQLNDLMVFQQDNALKFLSFCLLVSGALLHTCWTLQNACLVHHDIHPAQVLVTADGRPRLADLGQCSVLEHAFAKQLLPPLGRRDFCRPAKLGPLQGAEVDGYGCGATLWVTWQGSYDQVNRLQRDWCRHDARDALEERISALAAKALASPPPRWAFAQRVRSHIAAVSPVSFGKSVRYLLERLVTAYDRDAASQCSSFSADTPFSELLPFLAPLRPELAQQMDVCLDPQNFSLPVVGTDDHWPPAPGATLHSVYEHALTQLQRRDEAIAASSRGRCPPLLPSLSTKPVPLNAEPCQTLLLHGGRLAVAKQAAVVRLTIISMQVVAKLPLEIPVTILFSVPAAECSVGRSAAPPLPPMTLSFRASDFVQQGPSGPIEAVREISLEMQPSEPLLTLRFDVPTHICAQVGLATPAPMIVSQSPATSARARSRNPVPVHSGVQPTRQRLPSQRKEVATSKATDHSS